MRLILTRHGETEENKAGIIQGHLPGTLSELGKEQAKKVAERLKDVHIDKIYSSDLARAADTAKEIVRYHDCPIEFTQELRERHVGELQGKKKTDQGWDPHRSILWAEPKQGETQEQLLKRAEIFLDKIVEEHKDEIILMVGHGALNKALISKITRKKLAEVKNMGNTAITIFELEENNHRIIVENCSAHL